MEARQGTGSLEENDVPIVPKDIDLVGMYYTRDRKVELLAWEDDGPDGNRQLMRYAHDGKIEPIAE